jgi:hypothetical protein
MSIRIHIAAAIDIASDAFHFFIDLGARLDLRVTAGFRGTDVTCYKAERNIFHFIKVP